MPSSIQPAASTEPDDLARPGIDDVVAAAARLQGVAHRTPVMTSRTADKKAGAQLFFKCENFQRGGAFKFRGAYNAIAALTDEQKQRGVVTYSSGNHAQAVAYAGKLLGTSTTIIMPKDAPALKISATQEYGGQVQFYDRYTENREEIGRRLAQERGLTLIPPYDHPDVIAGQGTAMLELLDEAQHLDVLYVPLGGGGLLAGSAIAARAHLPDIRIIGVEPEAGNDGQQSLKAGKIIHIPAPKSIADGAIVTHVGHHNFPILQDLVDDIVTVSDAELAATLRFFAERMKIVVEPTGCLGAAAAFASVNQHRAQQRVGIILSGGNVDLERYSKFLTESSHAGT